MNRKDRRQKAKLERRPGERTNTDALFEKAAGHLRNGRLERAESFLRRVVAGRPDHADAFHLLGLATYEQGRPEEAAEAIRSAIAADGNRPVFHSNLAVVLNLLERPGEAETACRRAIELHPRYAEAQNNLAVALKLQGRLDDAAEACAQALEQDPEYVEAYVNLGNVRRHQGRLEEAAAAYGEAISRNPRQYMAHANLGAALRELGDLEGAAEALLTAVDLRPDYAEAHNNLGNVLIAAGDAAGAEASYRRALYLDSEHVLARVNLGAVLFSEGAMDDAEAAYRKALETDPDFAEAENGLGVVLQAAGDLDQAKAAFRRAIAIKPDFVEAFYNLAASRDVEDAEVAAMEALLAEGPPSLKLHFALGEAHDARANRETAFGHFRQGNTLRGEELAFDADAHDTLLGDIARTFTREFLAERASSGNGSEFPVFVVGMPRSGTTLVEQIAASHPGVHGAGELDVIAGLVQPFPERMADVEATDLAARYLTRLAGLGGDAVRVVDKTPLNFLYLGLIAILFPKARIVHCRRDARDVGLSCYFQNFVAGHAWSTDLADLARYQRAHETLMAHWREVLPAPMLEIDYEDLVADPEGQSRRLMDFLGLPWDDACLSFQESRRVVRSASNWQVRRPVHTASVGRWRAYEEWLGPLVE